MKYEFKMSVSVSVDNLVLCWGKVKCVCLIGKNDRLKMGEVGSKKKHTHIHRHDFKGP